MVWRRRDRTKSRSFPTWLLTTCEYYGRHEHKETLTKLFKHTRCIHGICLSSDEKRWWLQFELGWTLQVASRLYHGFVSRLYRCWTMLYTNTTKLYINWCTSGTTGLRFPNWVLVLFAKYASVAIAGLVSSTTSPLPCKHAKWWGFKL